MSGNGSASVERQREAARAQRVDVGVEGLIQEKLTLLLRLKYRDSLADAVADLGRPDQIGRAFAGFQEYLSPAVGPTESKRACYDNAEVEESSGSTPDEPVPREEKSTVDKIETSESHEGWVAQGRSAKNTAAFCVSRLAGGRARH